MSVQTRETPTVVEPSSPYVKKEAVPADFDLDVRFLEVGSTVKDLIYMTDDGCGATCQSACSTTCG